MLRLPLLVALGALFVPAVSAPPAVSHGPHGVIEMHEKLFAALDRGDADAAAAFVAVDRKAQPRSVTMYLVDAKGEPLAATHAGEARDILAKLAAEAKHAGGTWSTKLVREQADCDSPELSYAILELERTHAIDGKTEVKRYRSSSLVRHEDGGWKLFHWHVSPADAQAR